MRQQSLSTINATGKSDLNPVIKVQFAVIVIKAMMLYLIGSHASVTGVLFFVYCWRCLKLVDKTRKLLNALRMHSVQARVKICSKLPLLPYFKLF